MSSAIVIGHMRTHTGICKTNQTMGWTPFSFFRPAGSLDRWIAPCAVQTGHYAAILPSIARTDLPPDRFAEFPLPLLKNYERVRTIADILQRQSDLVLLS